MNSRDTDAVAWSHLREAVEDNRYSNEAIGIYVRNAWASLSLSVATPPVRGDQEAAHQTIYKHLYQALEKTGLSETFLTRDLWQATKLAADDLSLPVQPGAGEREADQDRLIALMALAIQTAHGALQNTNNSPDVLTAALSSLTIALDMEAAHWQKYICRGPHSSSEPES